MTYRPISHASLAERRVLVVEDEYLIADDLADMLRNAGADVVGPAASLPSAIRLAGSTERIDAAILDIQLDGVTVFPLADELRARGIPMMFLTGCDGDNIPDDFARVRLCHKPVGAAHVLKQLAAILPPIPAEA